MTDERIKTVHLKTAVSIRRDLAEKSDDLARELGVTRSRLYAMALEEFVRKHEDRRLFEQLNEAYADGLDAEERRLLTRTKDYYRDRFGADG